MALYLPACDGFDLRAPLGRDVFAPPDDVADVALRRADRARQSGLPSDRLSGGLEGINAF